MKRALGWESGDLGSRPVPCQTLCVILCAHSALADQPSISLQSHRAHTASTSTAYLPEAMPGTSRQKSNSHAERDAAAQTNPVPLAFAPLLVVVFHLTSLPSSSSCPSGKTIDLSKLLARNHFVKTCLLVCSCSSNRTP